ncbi:MAG: L-aspartate oxidase, partial [Pseudomonadales bacterium]
MHPDTDATHLQYDVLIIGSGAAGMSLALTLPEAFRVGILCKERPLEGSTYYAQGGVAAVLDDYDTVDSHIEDTLRAGDGLCRESVVRFVVERSPEIIDWLVALGVQFDTRISASGRSEFHLTQEGGHSHRRVIHAADATGKEISEQLYAAVTQKSNVAFLTDTIALDVITTNQLGLGSKTVCGLYAFNQTLQKVQTIASPRVVIATGGASKVYLYTSNPDTASGDGIAMAWRAGCRVANMEFNQFHPTCLYHPMAKSFLISEALRGEGAILRLPNGEPFMSRFDDRAELASRDIVARAIDFEMKRLGCDHVLLDISHKPADDVRRHFPTIYERCLSFGIDITTTPIPIVPAAHYTCGGIMTDLCGRTDVDGLYAVGESTYTGLHGANRMASNSLLECLVFARAAAHEIAESTRPGTTFLPIPGWDASQVTTSEEDVLIAHNWDELRRLMWNYVGIVRSDARLIRAQRRVRLLRREIDEYYEKYYVNRDLIEL